jgi:hypothetical protein
MAPPKYRQVREGQEGREVEAKSALQNSNHDFGRQWSAIRERDYRPIS